MNLDERLLEVLVCPRDHGELIYSEDDELLYNPRLHLAYRVEDGIPVMIIDEAREVGEKEHDRLISGRDRTEDGRAAGETK